MAKLVDTFEQTANGLEIRWDVVLGETLQTADDTPAAQTPTAPRAIDYALEEPDGADRSCNWGRAGFTARILSFWKARIARTRHWWRMHHDYRQLMTMNDHDLADMGLSRGHIEGALRLGRLAARDGLLPEPGLLRRQAFGRNLDLLLRKEPQP